MNDGLWEANSDSTEGTSYRKITMEELKKKLIHHYDPSIVHKYSCALDILASFIKAHAFLYNQSCTYCKYQLNLLMLPCIFLSTMCSVLSSVSSRYENGTVLIGGVNAFVAFLLAIVNYLKLDAAAEAHHIASNHLDRLKILLEFTSGEILLFEHPLLHPSAYEQELNQWIELHEKAPTAETDTFKQELRMAVNKEQAKLIEALQERINIIKERVLEIKENNRFAVPSVIMNHYPIIYNINVFSFIKTVEDYRMGLITTLKNILNEIRFINRKDFLDDKEKKRVYELYENKNALITELIMLTSTHNLIEVMFQQEIKNDYLYTRYWFWFWMNNVAKWFNIDYNFLPAEYKNPYDCGFIDPKTNKSLLRKILNV